MNTSPIFEFKNVSKLYGDKKVFENFSFQEDWIPRASDGMIPILKTSEHKARGAPCTLRRRRYTSDTATLCPEVFKIGATAHSHIVALLGANGAGKTTLIKMLLGQSAPTQGNVFVQGKNPTLPSTRAHIGATPQELDFPEGLKTIEILDFVRSHYKHSLSIEKLSSVFGLEEFILNRASKLSGGQKRRLGLALAFAGNPSVVFLDEPTTGLDVIARKSFWEFIQNETGKTIFLTTHDLSEIEKVAHHLLFLQEGKIVFSGTVSEFKKTHALSVKKIKFHAEESYLTLLESFEFIKKIHVKNNFFTLDTYQSDDCIRELVKHHIPFQGLSVESVSLEESFLNLSQV